MKRFSILLLTLSAAIVCTSGSIGEDKLPQNGLTLWLDSTDPNGDAKQVNSKYTSVAKWADKSGRSNHVFQNNKQLQPAWIRAGINGKPAVRLQGSHVLQRDCLHGFALGDQPFHIFFVMKAAMHSQSPNPRLLDLRSGGLSEKRFGFWVGYQGNGRNRLGIAYGDEGEARSIAWNVKPHILEVVYEGNQRWAQFLDGKIDGRGQYAARTFLGFKGKVTLAIGQHFGLTSKNTYYRGDLSEILVYNRTLTSSEQNLVGQFLAEKYAIETTYGPVPRFEKDIRPILAQRCFRCHGEKRQKAKLDLRTVSAMMRGGVSGPAIVRGHPKNSELLDMLVAGKMPPAKKDRLTESQISLIRRWIRMGAPADEKIVHSSPASLITEKDRKHWAFQKPNRPKVPPVKNRNLVRTPIDHFILAKLEAKKLSYSQPADKHTLIRRAHLDLIGLPPSPEEISRFVNDRNPNAFEHLVDRLLKSPHFGERWGRHWLDAAGYVDVTGSDNDAATITPMKGKWRYRDYVIRSYNDDKPFNRFLIEQLAGDELYDWRSAKTYTPEMKDALIATGFLLCAADSTGSPELNTPDVRHRVLQMTSEIVANNLFALTLQCAKCHNHKYEAIPQQDYFRFQAVFAPAFNPDRWVIPSGRAIANVAAVQKTMIDRCNAALNSKINALKNNRKTQKKDKNALAKLDKQIASLESQRKSYGTIQLVTEKNAPTPTFVLRRGNHQKPGHEVQAGLLSVLSAVNSPNDTLRSAGNTSGRRLALAKHLTIPNSRAAGLIARVAVNRIWQNLFGKGIVATSDNFGVSGAEPTHPRLLDWLAAEYIQNGWRKKPLIKLIMTSNVYRQTSRSRLPNGTLANKIDPANKLLWKMRLRQLPSEIIRDSLLAVSGKLDRKQGGPPILLKVQPDGKVVIDTSKLPTSTAKWRRSVYVLARRNYHLSMLGVFDQPVVSTNCTRRSPSAVVTQSLTMLNDEFVLDQAKFFAQRVLKKAETGKKKQVQLAFQTALGRHPEPKELKWCVELLETHAKRYQQAKSPQPLIAERALTQLCHVLLNANEFLYIH